VEDGMSLFDFFRRRPSSAQTAKERLQTLLANERQDRAGPEFLPRLKHDLIEAIRRHVPGAGDRVEVKLQRGVDIQRLEIEFELLPPPAPRTRATGRATTPAFAR
jgi:cell division topological specificity factor